MTRRVEASLTPHHRRLRRIATAASLFSWAALGGYTVMALITAVALYGPARMSAYAGGPPGEPLARLLNLASGVIGRLLSGVVSWLLLRGVALGLNMLVETDCNYRRRAQATNHE